MNYYFPLHLNGGNRGCEAIAKGTSILLGEPKEHLYGYCTNVSLDEFLGVSDYVTLIPEHRVNTLEKIIKITIKLFLPNKWNRLRVNYYFQYRKFLSMINRGDILLSTGGDMMCYSDNQVIYTLLKAKAKGAKTILWGCSMGKDNLTKRKLLALKTFDFIYARESLTENFLLSEGLNNVICFPDPAFILNPEYIELPSFFSKSKVIGLNISRMVVGKNTLDTNFGREICEVLEYIIHKTDYNVVLFPHVMWSGQDDRLLSSVILEKYNSTGRVYLFDTSIANYCQIRYAISQCRLFIGGRTHSVISAYSTCVPTLALGYSIKAKGIAKDLQLPDYSVVDCKNCKNGDFLNALKILIRNENEIRNHLQSIMPKYKARLEGLKEYIANYKNNH